MRRKSNPYKVVRRRALARKITVCTAIAVIAFSTGLSIGKAVFEKKCPQVEQVRPLEKESPKKEEKKEEMKTTY